GQLTVDPPGTSLQKEGLASTPAPLGVAYVGSTRRINLCGRPARLAGRETHVRRQAPLTEPDDGSPAPSATRIGRTARAAGSARARPHRRGLAGRAGRFHWLCHGPRCVADDRNHPAYS